MFSQSVPEHDVPAMQGREAEEEVKNWQELDDHGGRNMARTQRREHIDGRLREKVSMWTVLETFSFVFWLNLFNIYAWPHKDSGVKFSCYPYCSPQGGRGGPSCLQLQAQTQFVATSVDVLPIHQRRQGEFHAWNKCIHMIFLFFIFVFQISRK